MVNISLPDSTQPALNGSKLIYYYLLSNIEYTAIVDTIILPKKSVEFVNAVYSCIPHQFLVSRNYYHYSLSTVIIVHTSSLLSLLTLKFLWSSLSPPVLLLIQPLPIPHLPVPKLSLTFSLLLHYWAWTYRTLSCLFYFCSLFTFH